MRIPTDHPFQPGVRVAFQAWRDGDYVERFVDKVYKTGHFTLRGDTQRWRPQSHRWNNEPVRWTADETGDRWSRNTVLLWDETTDKEISAGIARNRRRDRLYALRKRIEALGPDQITEEALDAIEAALTTKAEGREA